MSIGLPVNKVIVAVGTHVPRELSDGAIERLDRMCALVWNDDYLWERCEGVGLDEKCHCEECTQKEKVLDDVLEIYSALHPEKDGIFSLDNVPSMSY